MHTLTAAPSDLGSLHLNDTVSAATGGIALLVAAALYVIGKRVDGRPYLPRIEVLLVLTGATGIILTPLGSWLRSIVAWAEQVITAGAQKVLGDQAPWFGTAVVGVLALIALFALAMDLKGKKVDVWTFVLAVLVAITVQSIPGPVGHAALTTVTAVTALVDWPIAYLAGVAGAAA